MQVLRAQNAFTARAHAAADQIESLLADVALGAHDRPREDTEEPH
jgi:hypothetical protein